MRKVILVKHASPQVVPGVPSAEWGLSDDGRARCGPLAEKLAPHRPSVIVSSTEPKAVETAKILSERLGVPHGTADGLHEHDRSNVPHLPTREFISLMEVFFRRPRERVLGLETADEAAARIWDAIDAVLDQRAEGTVAIVTHGTVLALLLGDDPKTRFQLWRQLGLPSFVVVEGPDLQIRETVDRV